MPFPVTVGLLLAASLYLRGWWRLRSAAADSLPAWRAATFIGGLASIWIAIASPLGALDEEFLFAHMAQHLLLMTVAPPLLWLGAPSLPLLLGLPQSFSRRILGPILRSSVVQWLGRAVTQPFFCWLAATVVLLAWHVPSVYALALESYRLHEVEHASFLAVGLLFWWPVLTPWPSVARHSRWWTVLYLFLATLPCDALSAYLAFCDRVVYSSYLAAPRRFEMSALQDQQFAGALMWVFVTFAYLLPAVYMTTKELSQPRAEVVSPNLERLRP